MITLVLGRTRWRRRRSLARLGFAETDAFGRPAFLFLTDSHRKREVVASAIAARGSFEPDARVLVDLFVDLWNRFGDGRAIASELQLVGRALPLVEREPMLARMGPPATVASQLVRIGLSELRTRHRATLPPAVRAVVESTVRATKTDLPRPTALSLLTQRLVRPDPALANWLRSRPPVVVDDLVQPSPVVRDALLGLVEALTAHEVPTALSFECGNEAGPDALAAFFGAGEQGLWTQRSLAATADWRLAVFERFLGRGQARVVYAGEDGPIEAEAAVDEAADVADLWSQGAEAPIPEGLVFQVHPSVVDEVESVADAVAARLLEGCAPRDCLVSVTDADLYRPWLVEAFAARGVPVDLALATPLRSTPIGQVVALALRARRRELDPLDWLAFAGLLGRPAPLVRRALAPAGVHRGPPGSWRGRLVGYARRTEQPIAPLLEELVALEAVHAEGLRLDGTHPARMWVDELLARVDALGLAALSERGDDNRRARATLADALDTLADELGDCPLSVDTFSDFVERSLGRAEVYVRTVDSVPVTGILELRGLTVDHTWILGATRGRWPARPAPSPLTDATDARALQPADRLAEARFTLMSGVRNLVGRTGGSLTVSWPAEVQGRPVVPSRVVTEILETTTSGIQSVAAKVWPAATGEPLEPRGALDSTTTLTRLGVTAAETAMQCPARFWYHHVLRLRPEDPWDPELEPRRRGTALHRIFQVFYESRDLRVVAATEATTAAASLHATASKVLDEVEAEGGFEPALQAWARGRWLAGLLDDAPKGILGAWLDAEIARGIAPKSVETSIRLDIGGVDLVGTVDRVDETAGVIGVVDYKTGACPSRDKVERSLALQPLVYTSALAPKGSAASAYQLVGKPDSIRFAGWFGDKPAVDLLGGRRPVVADAEERAQRLTAVSERVRGVLGGNVAPTEWGEDLGGCTYCAFHRVCRVRHDREPPC